MVNLTTLATAEAWLQVTSDNGGPVDQNVSRLISASSVAILSFLNRSSLVPRIYNEVRNGTGSSSLILRQWPVIAIGSLAIGDFLVPAGVEPALGAAFLQAGYLYEPWDGAPPGRPCQLDLRGYSFPRGLQNTAIVYTAGYQVSAEPQIAHGATPTPAYTLTVDQPYGAWASDGGVVYALTGVPLVLVTGTPAQGQYVLGATPGQYVTSAADVGAALLISYGYVPFDIAQCCLEAVQTYTYTQSLNPFLKSEKYGEIAFSYNTVGVVGSTSPGDTMLTANITSRLQPYRRVMRAA